MTAAARTALVADVGGTRTRLALADGTPSLREVRVHPTPPGSLLPMLRAYLGETGAVVDRCAVAAAGRIRREHGGARVTLTNVALDIDAAELREFGDGPLLVNDLAAVAAALPHFATGDVEDLDARGAALQGARLVLGVGTGIGAAVRLADGALLETEAGHVELAAVAPAQRGWLAALPRQRASAEELLAGPGLVRLHAQASGERDVTVPTLIGRARAGDGIALATFAAYADWLGRFAGDLVLAYGAWGGVYMIGGVATGLGDLLDARAFRAGFIDKSRFADELAQVPVRRVLHPQPALLGLAALACMGPDGI
jgi:glucokinase